MHATAVRKARIMINPQLRICLLLGEGKWIGNRKEHTGRCKTEGDVLVPKPGDGFIGVNFIIRLYNLHMLM